MFTHVNFSDFIDAFRAHDRRDQFTYEGLQVLFDYLEQYEDDTGMPIELDVIALCCEYYETAPSNIAADYGIDLTDCSADDPDAVRDAVLEYLNDHTCVVGETDASIIYLAF